MENEKEFLHSVEAALSRLRTKVELYDFAGTVLYPPETAGETFVDFSQIDWSRDHQVWKDRVYYPVTVRNIAAFSLPLPVSDHQETAVLLSLLLEQLGQAGPASHSADRDEAVRRIFTENMHAEEIEAICNRFHIAPDEPRCAMYFTTEGLIAPAAQALNELFPSSSSDLVVVLSPSSLLLIKSMLNASVSELPELAAAIADTVLQESGAEIYVGIGDVKQRMSSINTSYHEAMSALSIGQLMRGDSHIYSYSSLLLERFISEIPQDVAEKYYEKVFSAVNGKLFNEEMVRTIDAFFSCGLNLSEAARNLYIHRNTLVYRLEKVLRETGLDLRSFDDAVTYKLMRMLGTITQKGLPTE